MVTTVNLPGSGHFHYFVGSKAECESWLAAKKDEYQSRFGGAWVGAYNPGRMTPNAEAKKWKYKDGSKVIRSL